ncbi:MAG: histidine kinase [Bacteroidales bacterium]|nr:histidine kinase [Bacteroidales bacterium]
MKQTTLYIDLAFCLIFLPLIIFIFPIERWLDKYPFFVYTLVMWLYVVYIVNRTVTIPLLSKGHRKMWVGIAILAVTVIVTYTITQLNTLTCFNLPDPHRNPKGIGKFKMYQQATWMLYLIVLTFSFTVGVLSELGRQRSRHQRIEYERNRAELALYRAQINPHFFFNTLNTIYGLLLTRSDKVLPAFEQFIDLTKYIYNNASREFVAIKEEADYIRQYVNLQSLRLTDEAKVSFDYEAENPEVLLPPMLLSTFVENAFKYGISSSQPSFIRIDLKQSGATTRFVVENSVFARTQEGSNKMGIANCRKRLELLYPYRHQLQITNSGEVFRVELELQTSPAS